MNNSKEYLMPTVVLVSITLIVTAVLALTHTATSPVIAELQKKTANEARGVVLDKGDSFSSIDVDKDADSAGGIVDVYSADNGAGVVITSVDSGFGGEITVMTGFDKDGKISGVTVLSHTETPGLGTLATDSEYLKGYVGAAGLVLSKDGAGDGDTFAIDTITGATVTSEAVYRAVDKALTYYNETGGGK